MAKPIWPITLRIMQVLSNAPYIMTLTVLKMSNDGSLTFRKLIDEVENRLAGTIVAGSTMTIIVSTLEREHFVTWRKGPSSAESVVTITPSGRGAVSTVQLFQAALAKQVLPKIDDPNFQQTLQAVLEGKIGYVGYG